MKPKICTLRFFVWHLAKKSSLSYPIEQFLLFYLIHLRLHPKPGPALGDTAGYKALASCEARSLAGLRRRNMNPVSGLGSMEGISGRAEKWRLKYSGKAWRR
jgi:hypothetical protein